jgi:hypothetical protein
VAIAQDVDFYRTNLFNRRNGSVVVISGLDAEVNSMVVYKPEDAVGELWTLDEAGSWISYDTSYIGTEHTADPVEFFSPEIATGATLHGKLFLAAQVVGVNRLHVWDGSTLRRTGLAPPPDQTSGAPSGTGDMTGLRYYRARYIVKDGDEILRRSEPNAQRSYEEPGTEAAIITKPSPTSPFEGETHWELEESDSEFGDYYRIATIPVGTTTYVDQILRPQDIPNTDDVVLAPAIGEYNLQGSYRWVIADRDRLIGAGNFEDDTQDASVEWSVVGDDTTGVGNDERRPTTTGNRLDLDGKESGPITGMFNYDGRIIVFKQHRTYELTHTGVRRNAYLPRVLSNTYGALPFSVIEGVDKDGRPALYFMDPHLGPMALTPAGFKILAPHLRDKFFSEVNQDAAHIANGVYHSRRNQVWWHLAGVRRSARGCCPPSDTLPDWPSFRWVYDVQTGGTSFHVLPRLCRAAAFWPDKPIITAEGGGLVRCDVDAAPDDYGYPFRAYVRTRAWETGNLLDRIVVRSAVVEGRSIQLSPTRRLGCYTPSGVTLAITLIRDYGVERRTAAFNLDQQAREEYVIKPVDNSRMGEATAIQIEIGDAAAVSQAPWALYRVALRSDYNGPNVS